jgi:hypothetical protein
MKLGDIPKKCVWKANYQTSYLNKSFKLVVRLFTWRVLECLAGVVDMLRELVLLLDTIGQIILAQCRQARRDNSNLPQSG